MTSRTTNPKSDRWAETQRRVLSGWLRNADAYNPWTMTVFGREADGDPVAMTLHPAAGTDSRSGWTGEFYLGAALAP